MRLPRLWQRQRVVMTIGKRFKTNTKMGAPTKTVCTYFCYKNSSYLRIFHDAYSHISMKISTTCQARPNRSISSAWLDFDPLSRNPVLQDLPSLTDISLGLESLFS